jgi:DNA polymerase delta subunit 1
VYFPYLLMNKKRYAGLYWTNPDKWDYMDCKGIETVRRDNCQLVRTMLDTCLRKILIDRSVEGAVKYAKDTISSLLLNKVDLSLLIITKSLSAKSFADGANKTPHMELAKRMRARDPGSAPVVGDRVPYVIVKAANKATLHSKSEDPIYVLENSVPIDFQYYLENQLSKPLLRLFECILPDAKVLLTGDHTRAVYKATPSAKIGLMRFTVKTFKCLGCKVLLPKGSRASLCGTCNERKGELYLKKLAVNNELERRFATLWTQCQRCQGSMHQDVLCSNKDCPIFYMRKKVQKDLADVQTAMERFQF